MSHVVKFKEPVASRVYQRDANGKAEIPDCPRRRPQDRSCSTPGSTASTWRGQGIKLVDGKLVGVPVGGPYTINCSVKRGAWQANDDDVGRAGVRGRPVGAGGPVQHGRASAT